MTSVTECHDNDSPWLVCKRCVANGECARAAATEPAGWRWRFKFANDKGWRYCERMVQGFDPEVVEAEPLYL
jgi:hypothetical protein